MATIILKEETRLKVAELFRESQYHQETVKKLSKASGELKDAGWKLIKEDFPDLDLKNTQYSVNTQTGEIEMIGPKNHQPI